MKEKENQKQKSLSALDVKLALYWAFQK